MGTLFDPLFPLSTLWRHRYASREEILTFQYQRLQRLVAHAYERVSYYRRLFDQHGLKPQDIRSLEDLSAIPITSKRELQALPVGEVVAYGVDPRRLITRVTSGSSGEPFAIRRTWWETKLLQALRLRALQDLGVRITDKAANVVLARPPQPQDKQWPVKLLRTLGLYRLSVFNCLLPAKEVLRQLQQFSPDVLGGFAGVLARLAQEVENEGHQALQPRFVIAGGEVLTPLMRRQIATVFNAPVFDLYASQEFMLLAWECKETGEFHTCDDGVIIEVLKDGKPVEAGERGEVVATNLHAFAMPFLRYRLGDVVTKGAAVCRCGKPAYEIMESNRITTGELFPCPYLSRRRWRNDNEVRNLQL
ncbi:MAG TPA: hypothetical protein VGX03_13210 [Candidatus Binatia bacterium]|nr:hypothetical protein [Candidatus Binatia bacterium]